MESQVAQQIILMLAETVLVSSMLLLFFRLRGTFGLAPIYTMLGVFFQLSNLLAATIYIDFGNEIFIGPGSVVLFPASIFAVLFVYIREDATEARKLIYALVATNLVASLLNLLVSQNLHGTHVINPFNLSPELFMHKPRIELVGSFLLFADGILIILMYEFFARRLPRSLFLPIFLSMTSVLAFDTVGFSLGCFAEQPALFWPILKSNLLGKTVTALLYSTVLTIYLQRFDVKQPLRPGERRALGDLFQVLTYRQKYEKMRIQATRDALTNVYNRAFFDDILASELALSQRSGRALALLMIDIDHFKSINDTFGHSEGDRVLAQVAKTMNSIIRKSDFLCRYGGEEFAVILPDADLAHAIDLAERLCAEVPKMCTIPPGGATAGAREAQAPKERAITITIGVASFPEGADSANSLIRLADARLYHGKKQGRNCAIASGSIDDAADPANAT